MQMILCIELISLHVQMFIPCVNVHCDTIYSDCYCLVKPCFTALILYCLIVLFLLHMHFKIFAYNDHLVLLFSGKTYSYGSRVSQFLELGVSEFW